MTVLVSFVVGLLFGIGLIVSGMADPAKVLGFLDVAGAWDPSLAFVMAGAVATAAIGFVLISGRPTSLLGNSVRLPPLRPVDRRLLAGSLTFGVGWGLAGFCPGPGLVALGMGNVKAIVFCAAMVLGMAVFDVFERRRVAAPCPVDSLG